MWTLQNKFLALIFLFTYWLIINLLVMHTPFTIFAVSDAIPVQQVYALESQSDSPASLSTENWQAQSLPDDWYNNNRQQNQTWYRSLLNVPVIDERNWAVYLPSVSHNAAVYINGIWVGQGGPFSDPVSRHHNEPLLFRFSSELLRSGQNQIDVRVKASFNEQGFLAQFYVAPLEQLISAYMLKHFVRVEIIQWLTIAMYLMALIVFAFWWARPQDAIYGIFSLELFFWATHNLNLFVSSIPFSARFWEAMTMSSFGWTIITMIFFNHRYAGGATMWIEKLLKLLAISGLGLFLIPDIGSVLFIGYRIWDSLLLVVGAYAIFHLLKIYWVRQDQDVFLMLLVGLPIMVFGLHDYLMINHYGNPQDGLIIQFSVIPAVLLFSWFMIRRFVKSINQAEHLAEHLERRVEEKTVELKWQYEKLTEMEKKSVLAEERERIMRDMHDGIGGQLVSVITLLQDHTDGVLSKIREKVQHSLTDLRFVIDSLDPVQNELPTMLGMMRLRLHDQLDAANIDLQWGVTDLPELPEMNPGMNLHIMRIVQEAITNCIKHAGCHKMLLATGVVNNQVFIDIIDYGRGMHTADVKNNAACGRGISNMKYRAEQIGGTLELNSSDQGTQVRLLLAVQ